MRTEFAAPIAAHEPLHRIDASMIASNDPITPGYTAQIIIVGAGPVGMTLALDLASRGVDVILVERNGKDAPPIIRCNHISAQSMEIFRRLGIVKDIRDAGLPPAYPHDVIYVTSLAGKELARIKIAARQDTYQSVGSVDSGWPTAEPRHSCNQLYFEPIIRRKVRNSPRIRIFYEHAVFEINQGASGVRAMARNNDGELCVFSGDYLVGCDGGASVTRRTIGATFEGDDLLGSFRSILFRAPDFTQKWAMQPAWMTWIIREAGPSAMVAIDGSDLWLIAVATGGKDPASIDSNGVLRELIGSDADFEILSVEDWHGRRLVADRFRDRKVMICGDSAHIWIPFAGYGMNSGIADAANLGWKLAANLAGWGGEALLQSYTDERQPMTTKVSKQVGLLARRNFDPALLSLFTPALEDDTPQAEANRQLAGQKLYEANYGQFACAGLNFGTFYDSSDVILHDGETNPPFDLTTYTPSTVPGGRTPYIEVEGQSLYDKIGNEFSLLRRSPSIDVSAFLQASAQIGMPVKVIDLGEEQASAVYDHDLLLSRPDYIVAWRGNSVPVDILAVLRQVTGQADADAALELSRAPMGAP